MGWANELIKFNDTFKSDKNTSSKMKNNYLNQQQQQNKYKNFANTCKFLRVED